MSGRLAKAVVAGAATAAITMAGATPALADWSHEMGPKAVGLADLSRPECDNVQQGSTGWCVVALQVALDGAGYRVAIDGSFGPVTAEMVRLLQGDMRVTVDGVVGANTRSALGAALDVQQTADRVLGHEKGFEEEFGGRLTCGMVGEVPFLGPICDDLIEPDPAG